MWVSTSNLPPFGTVTDREAVPPDQFVSNDGKLVVPLANVIHKLKLNFDTVSLHASKFGLSIPPFNFIKTSNKPGRPKKDSNTYTNTNTNTNTSKKTRGRPPKPKTSDSSLPPTIDLISSIINNNHTNTHTNNHTNTHTDSDIIDYSTISAKTIIIDNTKFIITNDNTLYDFHSREPIGIWNNNSIDLF